MYLAQLSIANFRKLRKIELTFQPGLNVLVGPNNIGKTAVVDALRALLAGHDEPYPRLDAEDVHRLSDGTPAGDIEFRYVFRGLDQDDEADFLAALKPTSDNLLEAHIGIRYSPADTLGRMRVKRWCGDYDDVGMTSDMAENLRGVYLPPLRDASRGLAPNRTSQLARLMQLLADKPGQEAINAEIRALDERLKQHPPLISTHAAISSRYAHMLGQQLSQALELGLSGSDFQRFVSRLSLVVDGFEIDRNGLGFNNLIFMAVVLSELSKNPNACYRALLVEEPEAHLHPQLQAVLLSYLERLKVVDDEKPVQLFVTSHSPNFASIAKLDSLVCLVATNNAVEPFCPRTITFLPGKREKLERYLDATRAELFFARRIIFVEGAAEMMLVGELAKRCGHDLREHGVSLISVDGLNFDSFLPLFGEDALRIPVAVITDADPRTAAVDGNEQPAPNSAAEEEVEVSDNTAKMKEFEDRFIKVLHGRKTLEYDLALFPNNREVMLNALSELHPKIAAAIRKAVAVAEGDEAKAGVIYGGMFERSNKNVSKGRFAQTLAHAIASGAAFDVPAYIKDAIAHACQPVELLS